jgi:membrane protease subunit HflC
MRILLIILAVVLTLVLLSQSYFTVDPTEFVYVTQFGAPVGVYDGGAKESDAGLHWRWPWPIQSVQRLDRRLQYFDLPAAELLTKDAAGEIDKTLTVRAYVCWRIVGKDTDPDGVDRFIRRMGTPKQAEATLGKRLNGELGAIIGQMRMDDLVSTDVDAPLPTPARRAATVALLGGPLPNGTLLAVGSLALDTTIRPDTRKVDVKLEQLRRRLLDSMQKAAQLEYGVELVDIRLRRFNHPAQVREAIFERIRTERARKVEEERTKGKREADNIRSEAQKKVDDLLAEARAKAAVLKGQADAEAAVIRGRAFAQDPELYVFLKKLEQMQSILGENKTMLLLSTHRPMFESLFAPPRPQLRQPDGPRPPQGRKEGGQ